MKKIFLTVFAASSLLLYSTPSFALLSVSVGMPMGYNFAEGGGTATNMGGYFLGVQLPFGLGLGMDSHKIKATEENVLELNTNMYNLFYQLPIPVINLILGIGAGSQHLECADIYGGQGNSVVSCKDTYDKGSATQFYTSVGFPIIPFFDIHLSYRSITSKNVYLKGGGTSTQQDLGGTITGVGIAFNF